MGSKVQFGDEDLPDQVFVKHEEVTFHLETHSERVAAWVNMRTSGDQ